jgi:hypothetical protein
MVCIETPPLQASFNISRHNLLKEPDFMSFL